MEYRYCTERMAENAAKKGLKAAVECSALKWWFVGTCTRTQFRKHYWDTKLDVSGTGDNCALCEHCGTDCNICPLNSCAGVETPFRQADMAADMYCDNPTLTNFRKFQAKARKLARIIERLKP